MTTKFTICDIWRGYWVQRMLWDMGASLSFLPPSAVQYRNEHNLLDDFADEVEMYLKTDDLIDTLIEWRSDKVAFADRIKDLISHLVTKEFFKPAENLLVDAWIEDLHNLNYSMPMIVS